MIKLTYFTHGAFYRRTVSLDELSNTLHRLYTGRKPARAVDEAGRVVGEVKKVDGIVTMEEYTNDLRMR